MKPSIRIILIAYAVAIAVACIYVPLYFEGVEHSGSIRDANDLRSNPQTSGMLAYGGSYPNVSIRGYGFAWNPTLGYTLQRYSDTKYLGLPAHLDWGTLAVELVSITVIAGIALLLTGTNFYANVGRLATKAASIQRAVPTSPPTHPEPPPTAQPKDVRALALSLKELAACLEPDVMHPLAIKAILLRFVKPRGLNLREVYEMAVKARPKEWNEKHPAPKWEELGIT